MKYGLKTVFRTPIKTGLFTLLIMVVTAFLSLGIGMWHSAETMLAEADAQFITAGEFTYTLGYYPHDEMYDKDLDALRQQFNLRDYDNDAVVLLEENVSHRATVSAGYNPLPKSVPYASYGVVRLKANKLNDDGTYIRGNITKAFYAFDKIDERPVLIVPYTGEDMQLEPGREYIAFAAIFTISGTRSRGVEVLSFSEDLHISPEFGVYPPLIDITDMDIDTFWQSDAGIYYQKVIDTLQTLNSAIDVLVSEDVPVVSSFHRGEHVLSEGAFPEGNNPYECVIPVRMAVQLELGVGDTLDLSIHHATGQTGRFDSYWPDVGYAAEESYVITGIYQSDALSTPVYILNTGQSWLSASLSDYNLGRVQLDNRKAAAYENAVSSKLPIGVQLEIYNQGYEAATRAIYSLREMAQLISGVCIAVGLMVLWFFAYLFVFQGGDTVNILLRLGTNAGKVMLFMLTGCSVIVLTAATAGSIGGYQISKRVILTVFESILSNPLYDYRFSIINRGMFDVDFSPMPEVAASVYILIVVTVFAITMLLCVLFGIQVIRRQNPHYRYKQMANRTTKQKKQVVTQPKQSHGDARGYDYIPGTALRFTAKSMFRGGWRSLAVPLLFAVLLVFVFLFSDVRAGYRQELASVYDDIPVRMWFTGYKGDLRENVMVYESQIKEIEEAGFTSESWYTNQYRAMYLGAEAYADGRAVETNIERLFIPQGEFGYETFLLQLDVFSQPLVVTNDISNSSVFNKTSEPQIEWLEGITKEDYDISALNQITKAAKATTPKLCLVSKNFLTDDDLSLGDTVSLALLYYNSKSELSNYQASYVIAGAYTSDIDRGTIFLPDGSFTNINSTRKGQPTYFYNGGAGFTVTDTERLGEFKDWLSEHYDPVGVAGFNRRWVIMDDKTLYNTIENLTRYVGYMDLSYPVVLGAVAVIGFIASSLLLKGRAREINALRTLGAGKIKVFFSFFMEPLFLSVPGILGGLVIAVLILGGLSAIEWNNVPLLAAFYYTGAAVAVIHTCRKALMQNKSAEA